MPTDHTLRILRRRTVEERTGLCRSRIYALIREGGFPKPVPLGGKSVGWAEHEVAGWINARIAERDAPQVRRGRRQPKPAQEAIHPD